MPEVTINEETALAEVNLKKKSYLNIRTHPVATSFAVFDAYFSFSKSGDLSDHICAKRLLGSQRGMMLINVRLSIGLSHRIHFS